MLQLFQSRPDLKAAHIFADHLEATLDLAEELELLHLIPGEHDHTPGRDVLAGVDKVGAFVERAETIEISIAAKLELARAAARRIAEADARLSTFTKLFYAGTQPLVDLWPALADPGRRIFDSGHDPLTFLQARGVVDESRSTLEGQKYLGTGADYLLLGTVKLGAFIELCDTCLKAIDRHYHIYEDDGDWEGNRARALDILRESRDEAIRVALGATPAIIDTPVEIVASDALDEAIELIEALTFPEEKRFRPDHPLVEEPPMALGPETVAEAAPLEIVEELAMAASPPIEGEAPVELMADAVVEPLEAPEASDVGTEALQATAKPGLLAPIAAAGRSLAAILARRKAAAAAKSAGAPVSEAPLVAAEASSVPETVMADVEAPEAAQLDEEVALSTQDVVAVAIPADEPRADAAATAQAIGSQITAVRRRLVDVIAERARSLAQVGIAETAPDAIIATAVAPEVLAGTIELLPMEEPSAAPTIEEYADAVSASDAEALVPEAPGDAGAPILALMGPADDPMDAAVGECFVSAPEVAGEAVSAAEVAAVSNTEVEAAGTAAVEAVSEAAVPAAIEPVHKKRPRRKSRRRAAARKRRTKR